MFAFGSGVLMGVRTADATGAAVTNGTGINFGLVQEVTLDTAFNTKKLYGQYQFPVAVARGTATLTGKAKVAKISAIALATLFFGYQPSPGQLNTSVGEAATIPGSPYQVTVSNAANFVDDYGVIYAATGVPFVRVTSSPAQGEYSVNTSTGVYTFNASDTATDVLFTYTYTVSGTGFQWEVNNQLLGATPSFQAQFYTTFQGNPMNVKMYSCVSSKLSMPTKLEDFTIPEFDFDIFANAAGNVMKWSTATQE